MNESVERLFVRRRWVFFFPTATPDVAVKINAEDTTGRHSPARLDWRSDIRDIA